MPRLLRRNLTCFYCGRKSPNSQAGQVRQWHCQNCDAVNHLDENGQITDPPAFETQAPVQYAHIPSRSTSPELASGDRELFCSTCQKNQYLLTESLANYLPSQDDPSYAKYEAAAAQYKKSLEERYPQVCANCVHKVRDRIKLTSYAAKTDHMRRLLQQTRQNGIFSTESWGWRNLIVFVGGQAYLLNLIFSLLWHTFGALLTSEQEEGMSPVDLPGYQMCLSQAATEYGVEPACFSLVLPLAKYAFVLELLSIWWNSALQTWVRGSKGRMVGLGDHLKLQLIVLAVRAASLWYLQELGWMAMALHVFKAGHLFMIIFILITSFISTSLVTIDTKPKFSFNDSIDHLLPTAPQNLHSDGTPRYPGSTIDPLRVATGSSFPISTLAPAPSPIFQYPTSPTIPSAASVRSETELTDTTYTDRENDMDWTPTRPSPFQPRRAMEPIAQLKQPQLQLQPQQQQPIGRSPFYGALPAAPKTPAQKIANPFPQPVFQRVSATTQKDFFSKLRLETENTGSGVPVSNGMTTRASEDEFQLREAQFQLKEDPVDTGLEAMFGSVFSIGDEPAEVRAAQAQGRPRANTIPGESSGFWAVGSMILFGCLPIGIGAVLAIYTGKYEIPWNDLKARG